VPDTDGGHRQHNRPSIGEGPSASAPFPVAKIKRSGSGVPASDAAGDEAGPRDQVAVRSFIEGFTSLLTQAGFPRTPARIFVALLTSDSSKFTAAELAELLQTSPASVSGGVRYLIQVGLVTAEGEPGSRRQHYRMPTDVWDEIVRLRNRQFSRWVTELREGVSALGADTPAGSRLAQTVRYFDFLTTEMADLLTRWQHLGAGAESAGSRLDR